MLSQLKEQSGIVIYTKVQRCWYMEDSRSWRKGEVRSADQSLCSQRRPTFRVSADEPDVFSQSSPLPLLSCSTLAPDQQCQQLAHVSSCEPLEVMTIPIRRLSLSFCNGDCETRQDASRSDIQLVRAFHESHHQTLPQDMSVNMSIHGQASSSDMVRW